MRKRSYGLIVVAIGGILLVGGHVGARDIDGSGSPMAIAEFSQAAEDEDGDATVPAGTIDDGEELLSQATISLDDAIAAAQASAPGNVGEIDLEYVDGQLVFNVDVGTHDVKVDATTGDVTSVDSDD